MTIKEVKEATTNELIVGLVQAHTMYQARMLTSGKLSQAMREIEKIQAEMLKRGILTEQDIELLNK